MHLEIKKKGGPWQKSGRGYIQNPHSAVNDNAGHPLVNDHAGHPVVILHAGRT